MMAEIQVTDIYAIFYHAHHSFMIYFFLLFAGLGSEVALLCSSCNETFLHPWDLLEHVQKTHSLYIYEEMEDNIKELPMGIEQH